MNIILNSKYLGGFQKILILGQSLKNIQICFVIYFTNVILTFKLCWFLVNVWFVFFGLFFLYSKRSIYYQEKNLSSMMMCIDQKMSMIIRGFTKFGIKVLWRLHFLEYLRTLRLKFQKAQTEIDVVLSLPRAD